MWDRTAQSEKMLKIRKIKIQNSLKIIWMKFENSWYNEVKLLACKCNFTKCIEWAMLTIKKAVYIYGGSPYDF